MGGVAFTPQLAIGLLAFAIEVIAGTAYFYVYNSHHNGIQSGFKPAWLGGGVNMGWYGSYSIFCFGLISILFAVAELGLLFAPQYFGFVDSPVLRAVVYILKGIATLGVSNDLGIAAGSLEIIIGVVMILFVLLTGGLGALKGGGKK
jgi:hypothetical protein